MPQVIGGEIGNIDTDKWSCGDCADAGQEYEEEEAKVIMHSVCTHKAFQHRPRHRKKDRARRTQIVLTVPAGGHV